MSKFPVTIHARKRPCQPNPGLLSTAAFLGTPLLRRFPMVTRLLALLPCVCVVALPPDEMPTLVPSPAPEAPAEQQAVAPAAAEQQAVAPAAAPTSLPKLAVPLPIINLGMPKSGSSSVHDFFKCGGFNSAHLLCNDGMGSGSCPANAAGTCRCGSCMHENLVAGRPIFEGCGTICDAREL